MKRSSKDADNREKRELMLPERTGEGQAVELSLERARNKGLLSRSQMLKLPGGAIAGAFVGFNPIINQANAQTTHIPLDGELSPLNQYWNAGRRDYFLTSTEQGRRDAIAAGYSFVRLEGWVYASKPGSVAWQALQLFWNPNRTDNYTTASPQGQVSAALQGYKQVRIEGWIAPSDRTKAQLNVYWHPFMKDYLSTATNEGYDSARGAGYSFVRREGWLNQSPNPLGQSQLKVFWHEGRGDYMTAATYAAAVDAARAGYQCLPLTLEGSYISPTQLRNTVPLTLYWNPVRGDNFTTATVLGHRDAQAAGYTLIRTEGYVWSTQSAAEEAGWVGVPLGLYWHPGRQDNLLTSDGTIADIARREGYTFIRHEGFVRRPVFA